MSIDKSLARRAAWNSQVAQSDCTDKILVQNLAVTVNAGTDVWGRRKKQRALISVTVTLGNHFSSASSTDTVDESTVHYGTLSKAIQGRIQDDSLEWMSTADLSIAIAGIVRTAAGSAPIFAIETDACYVKGSMFGDGAGHQASIITATGIYSNVLYLKNVRVPCLIGVNANERLQKQPIVINLWVDCVPASRVDDYAALETALVQVRSARLAPCLTDVYQIVSATAYETLESLLAFVVQELKSKFFVKEEDQNAYIRLRMEKPMAVPFADAPAVEVTRPLRSV
jgi:dihydroneopterin aldolase